MPLISLAIRMFEQQNNLISQLARTLLERPVRSPLPHLLFLSHHHSQPHLPSPEIATPPSLPDVHHFSLFFPPFTPPPHFFSPARCQPFLHSLTVGMKGGFLGRLGNGILWALSGNLQIKRAGLMESNGGRECWDVGKRLRLLAASQKTSKISLFVN